MEKRGKASPHSSPLRSFVRSFASLHIVLSLSFVHHHELAATKELGCLCE